MSSQLQNALIFIIYGVALGGVIVSSKYGWIDPQFAGGLIGAILTHMGISYVPPVVQAASIVKSAEKNGGQKP